MEPGAETPPFWSSQPIPRSRRPPLLNPITLMFFAVVTIILALLILFVFILPSFLPHINQTPKTSTSVKKGWDTLNVVLVLFAVLCGVFARRYDESANTHRQIPETVTTTVSNIVVNTRPRRSGTSWLDFPDQKEYNEISSNVLHRGMRRSSTSYPDLRQASMWQDGAGVHHHRSSTFIDDFNVNFHRSPSPPPEVELRRRGSRQSVEESERIVEETQVMKEDLQPRRRRRRNEGETLRRRRRSQGVVIEEVEEVVKDIPVDKVEVATPPPRSPAPLPPPPLAATTLKRRRSSAVPRKKNIEKLISEAEIIENQPPPPPPPPPPESESKSPEAESKTNLKKEIATVITSLYKTKKKNKVIKNTNIYETAPTTSPPPPVPQQPPATPPPPPPPPPPSKVLQNLFKKTTKNKRIHSLSPSTPPPPPPPPPNSIFNNIFKSKRFQSQPSTSKPPPPPPEPPRRRQIGKPPKPNKPSVSEYHAFIAPSSPLIQPPPPPPSFSSRGSSPEIEDVEDAVSVKSEIGDSVGPSSVSCPSPDVNAKADSFIARLRDEWRLEKMNSFRQNRNLV